MKKGRSKSIFVVTTQGSEGKNRKYPYTITSNGKKPIKKQNAPTKGNGKNVTSTSNALENKNYCHKFWHKKTDYKKLKVVQEKKGNH